MSHELSRRDWLACAGLGISGGMIAAAAEPSAGAEPSRNEAEPFRYCLNMGTISGHDLSAIEEVEVAAKAGYSGIEPWVRKLRKFAEEGGSLNDLGKRIADAGLTVESAIGFPAWAVEDDQQRAKALVEMQADMEMIARIGGKRIAAPPAGINRTPGLDLFRIAERYRAVLELGRKTGVVPQLEIWGSAQTLGRVGEAALVAIQANHPDACLLLDVFHIYKGGTGFECLKLLNGAAMHAFHINDYPADPPWEEVNDSHRVYPGDGVAPISELLRDLHRSGFRGALSLELFNRDYWQQDALAVARTGLEKIRDSVQKAMA